MSALASGWFSRNRGESWDLVSLLPASTLPLSAIGFIYHSLFPLPLIVPTETNTGTGILVMSKDILKSYTEISYKGNVDSGSEKTRTLLFRFI